MTSHRPPLTVALLTYNRLHYLKESVRAILDQSFGDFELLILDNCSTDGTAEFILGLEDSRIRYVRNAPSTSVQFNCVSAWHIASGHRVIATHDDDIMEREMLARQMRFLDEHPEARLVWVGISDIDQDGKPIGATPSAPESRLFAPGEYIASFLKERLWPMPSGVMFERAQLPRSYLERFYFCTRRPNKTGNPLDEAGIEDVLLAARINRRHAIGYLGEPLLRRRIHTAQFTHTASLSRPGIHLYRDLKAIARGIPGQQAQPLHFDACIARFEIQEAITCNAGERVRKSCQEKARRLSARLQDNAGNAPEACLAGLPVLLLDHLLDPGRSLRWLDGLSADGHNSATRKLLAWAKACAHPPEASVLAPLAGKRIILFGSAFIAALLILEARRTGASVIACVDSNSNRQGRTLLGIPIRPPAWMRDEAGPEDLVVITSERDHEHYIASVIRQNLRRPATIESWKNLIG